MSAPAILLVDDEPVVLQAMARTLSRRGHRVRTADSAAAARRILQEDEVAVLISDQRLGSPDPDGVDLLTQVRQRWPLVERVLLTGFADIPSMERAINEAGVSRFLSKPWEDVDLCATVSSAVEQWESRVENRHLLAQLAGSGAEVSQNLLAQLHVDRNARAFEAQGFEQVCMH